MLNEKEKLLSIINHTREFALAKLITTYDRRWAIKLLLEEKGAFRCLEKVEIPVEPTVEEYQRLRLEAQELSIELNDAISEFVDKPIEKNLRYIESTYERLCDCRSKRKKVFGKIYRSGQVLDLFPYCSLYKGRYLIAVYDGRDESLIDVFNNVREMSEGLRITFSSAKHMVSDTYRKRRSSVYIKKTKCTIKFIPMEGGDIDG